MQQQSQSSQALYDELATASAGDMTSLWYMGLSFFLFCLLCNLGRRFSRVEQRLYELETESAKQHIANSCFEFQIDCLRKQGLDK